jgi:class 3 adenylate cyclase
LNAQTEEVRRFIGIEPPPPALDSVLASILFTDIVGSTARQASLGDAAWKALLEQHHAAVRHEIERWHGSEVDTAGDGFYATFEGPVRAVRCALDVGSRVRDLGLEIRAGVHVGECTLIDGKVGGLPVTIGARIAALAAASEVLVSQTVKDLVPGSGLAFESAGQHELKGVPDSWNLYRVTS